MTNSEKNFVIGWRSENTGNSGIGKIRYSYDDCQSLCREANADDQEITHFVVNVKDTMPAAESLKLSFSVSGESLNKIVKDLVLEDNIRNAIRLLLSAFPSFKCQDLEGVISGKKAIRGDSDTSMWLEDHVNTELEAYFKRYEHFVEFEGKFWVPYAMVTSWGQQDIGAGDLYGHPRYNSLSTTSYIDKYFKILKSRNVMYMNNRQKDIQQELKVEGGTLITLWEETKEPPYWLNIGNDWQAAIDSYVKNGYQLEERGHIYLSREHDCPIDSLKDAVAKVKPKRSAVKRMKSSDFIHDLINSAGIDKDAAKGVANLLTDNDWLKEREKPEALSNEEIKEAKYGYVLPNGKFYKCEYHGHDQLASDIYELVLNKECNDPTQQADKDGWARIQKSAIDGSYYIFHNPDMKPTNKQKDTVMFWMSMNNIKYCTGCDKFID